jgi:oligoribonuclease NrnB/cAMP/cGMP phosphodiesterase (DHH superfamily)
MKRVHEIDGDILLITHKNCKDGLGAAMAMTKYCNDNNIGLEIHWSHYGDSNMPDISGKNVIIADFSFKRTVLEEMFKITKSLVVLDHHKTAMSELSGLDYCLFDMDRSGAIMMWDYLYPGVTAPLLLQYIQDRDLWNWELDKSHEVSAAIDLNSFNGMLENYSECLTDNYVHNLMLTGTPIYAYQLNQIDKIRRKADYLPVVEILGHPVPCLNNNNLISEVGNMLTEFATFSLQYFITENDIVFSLRSSMTGPIGFVDVEQIAKEFGGGGHPEAAGFKISLSQFKYKDFFIKKVLIPH